MSKLWREFYFRISLGGGLIALLLINSGSLVAIRPWSEDGFKPKEMFLSPVMISCEEKQSIHLPFEFDQPSWCQASSFPGELGLERTKNIFKVEDISQSKGVTLSKDSRQESADLLREMKQKPGSS